MLQRHHLHRDPLSVTPAAVDRAVRALADGVHKLGVPVELLRPAACAAQRRGHLVFRSLGRHTPFWISLARRVAGLIRTRWRAVATSTAGHRAPTRGARLIRLLLHLARARCSARVGVYRCFLSPTSCCRLWRTIAARLRVLPRGRHRSRCGCGGVRRLHGSDWPDAREACFFHLIEDAPLRLEPLVPLRRLHVGGELVREREEHRSCRLLGHAAVQGVVQQLVDWHGLQFVLLQAEKL
mmetsp:Transcript_31143/g.77650  ORF Transcript_31143/g.77650 Transcript_31143/m.77650 type:complete len:239 (+) Transcript_31143:1130-1846(+)